MPFTFSHPAIVLPLKKIFKNKVSTTGLIAGSITPDFEYFFRMQVKSVYTHTLVGMFTVDIFIGFVIMFLFHEYVRNPLINNSPVFFQKRFLVYKEFKWINYFKKNVLIIILSLLIGIASHLFWDAFTHKHGYFVQYISFLQDNISTKELHFPVYKLLQHVSSIAGAAFIFYLIYKMPASFETLNKKIFRYWILVIIIAAIVFLLGIAYLPSTISSVIIIFISSLLFGITSGSYMFDSLFEENHNNG